MLNIKSITALAIPYDAGFWPKLTAFLYKFCIYMRYDVWEGFIMMVKKVAILGAGNGGMTAAADGELLCGTGRKPGTVGG